MQTRVCANFIFDMNGNKEPNTIGKDMGFMTVFYPKESLVVAPDLHKDSGKTGLSVDEGAAYCLTLDSGYRLPNAEEAASIYVNKSLIAADFSQSGWLLTSKKFIAWGVKQNWVQSMYSGCRVLTRVSNGNDHLARCVKR